MSTPPTDPKRLCAVPSDVEAAMLVSQLSAAGIEAWTEGGPSTQYRAEAPGMAYVLVPATDLERAAAIVADSLSRPTRRPGTSGGGRDEPGRSPMKTVWVIVAVALIVLIVLGYVAL